MKKTNAMRILDGLGIKYKVTEYDDDGEHTLSRGAAGDIAQKLGLPPERVFKTIVMKSCDGECFVFCQNALHDINLKKARAATGARSIEVLKSELLLPVTGYVRGGCSPIGMKKKLATFVDESALSYDTIFISAGVRGMQLEIAPNDLLMATGGVAIDLKL